jgi:sterol desaturase/sphingolipid hydroxylase (fatty acid hydroxylase superfamily)
LNYLPFETSNLQIDVRLIMDAFINVLSHTTFIFILIAMIIALYLERRYPHYPLSETGGWTWKSVVFSNIQLFASIFGKFICESYLTEYHIFDLKSHLNGFCGGIAGYTFSVWFFYLWHLLRHEVKSIWLCVHYFRHNPRVKIMTSQYERPIEIISNSIIMIIIAHPLLCLSLEAAIWMNIWVALREFFYHINLETPNWLGFFIQKPKPNRVHHLRDEQPIWVNIRQF